MFNIGDWVIYGGKGVCKVIDIGKLETMSVARDRIYYTLEPAHFSESRVFTPVDNSKVVIRQVITKEEAVALIDQISQIETLWITDEKRRESEYKEALKTCDCIEFVKIIKTIYQRKQTRLEVGKKMTASDEKYFRIAEDLLYSELAIALEMEQDKVKSYILEHVKK